MGCIHKTYFFFRSNEWIQCVCCTRKISWIPLSFDHPSVIWMRVCTLLLDHMLTEKIMWPFGCLLVPYPWAAFSVTYITVTNSLTWSCWAHIIMHSVNKTVSVTASDWAHLSFSKLHGNVHERFVLRKKNKPICSHTYPPTYR